MSQVDGRIERYLDVGCGFGGLTRLVANRLGVKEVHGVDIDGDALKEAALKGVATELVDISSKPLPFQSGYFDLITSFGVLDYLPYFDKTLQELVRVLRPSGYLIVSLPNLASWHNRMALLAGYQPRDVEICSEKPVGTLPWYRRRGDRPVGHIHTGTVRAMRELLERSGLRILDISGARYPTQGLPWFVAVLDWLASKTPSLARRVFYLARKSAASLGAEGPSGRRTPQSAP